MNERGKKGKWDENEALSVSAKRAHLVCGTSCLGDTYQPAAGTAETVPDSHVCLESDPWYFREEKAWENSDALKRQKSRVGEAMNSGVFHQISQLMANFIYLNIFDDCF